MLLVRCLQYVRREADGTCRQYKVCEKLDVLGASVPLILPVLSITRDPTVSSVDPGWTTRATVVEPNRVGTQF
jgi:hypothetical protein